MNHDEKLAAVLRSAHNAANVARAATIDELTGLLDCEGDYELRELCKALSSRPVGEALAGAIERERAAAAAHRAASNRYLEALHQVPA